MRNFKELKIWQKGFKVAVDVQAVLKEVDEEQKMMMSFITKLHQPSQ